jgi:hypothetical protein
VVWRLAVVLFALQAVGLIVYSRHLYDRYDLTSDFATFSQAWDRIGTGHLDPYLSTFAFNYPHYGYSFWRSHFEVLMWPLALLRPVFGSTFTLLVVQDLALAGSGLVATRWGLELAGRNRDNSDVATAVLGAGLVAILAVNPWTYWTASYDFHFQPIACLFVLLAGRDLWNGRRRAWIWLVVVLACGDVAATYVVALGVSALIGGLSRRKDQVTGPRPRTGALVVLAGAVALGVISSIGSGKGSTLPTSYGYLADGRPVTSGVGGILAIVRGIVRHPSVGWHVVSPRRHEIFKYVASTGTLGVLSAVALPMAVVVLGANGLNTAPNFVGAAATFQSLVVVLFTAVGAVGLLTWLLSRGTRAATVLTAALGLVMVAQAAYVSVQWTPRARTFLQVPASTAAQLDRVRRQIPTGAEVVVSQGVIGRFGAHAWVYPFLDSFANGQTVPLNAPTVVFVFTDVGIEAATPAQTAAAEALVGALPGVRILTEGVGVEAFSWSVPASTPSLTFAQ